MLNALENDVIYLYLRLFKKHITYFFLIIKEHYLLTTSITLRTEFYFYLHFPDKKT